MEKSTQKHDLAGLERIYQDGESQDKYLFSEMRTNLRLVSGEHYNQKEANFFNRIRDSRALSEEQRLRLTKNHIQKIIRYYAQTIISQAPGVSPKAKNESDLQDQKAAELHKSVWRDAVERYNINSKVDQWADEFFQIGEAIVKIFWDPNAGTYLGEETTYDANGEASTRAVFSGEFIFEQVFGFNLIRPAECKNLEDAEWLAVRKMVKIDALKRIAPDKEKMFVTSQDETVIVFDDGKYGTRPADKDEVLVKEYFFKPCANYPRGQYFYTTKSGVFAQGDLPGGIFPIVLEPCDNVPTSPRGRSPIKTARPYQVEINRAASKIAEHQITIGDDKLIIPNGTKISQGSQIPGIRAINVQGMAPTILAGRDGSQYLPYMESQISEMYDVMNVPEKDDPITANIDAYSLLFRAGSQKKYYSRYIRKFEQYLKKVCGTYLKLAKVHLPEDRVITAIGKSEIVNISEFKKTPDIHYRIELEEVSEDIETKLGRQLSISQVIQYAGGKLDKEDIGKLIRTMPYANVGETMSDLTLNYDSATNDILALDRGETPPVHEYDDHPYMIKRLVSRMRKADFKYLPEEVQRAYALKVQAHEEAEAFKIEKLKQMQNELIPVDGYLVGVDFYVNMPGQTTPKRARVPYTSIQWLLKRLEEQGQTLETLDQMGQGAAAQMAGMLTEQNNAGGGEQGSMMPPAPM